MKTAYLFPGQGSQYKGMGENLFEAYADLTALADDILGYSIKTLCVDDPDNTLHLTQYTQPAIYVVSALSYLDQLAKGMPKPDAVAGHSLGEYNALFAAGVFDFATGVKLVQQRGYLMSKAPAGAMAAVMSIDQQQVQDIVAQSACDNVDIANINSQQQTIISGLQDEIAALEKHFNDAGAKFYSLNVSAAFHSRCMTSVEQEFARFLTQFDFKPLQCPVIANISARPYEQGKVTDYLLQQITGSVNWYETVSWLLHQQYQTLIEIGPGTVLTKLVDAIKQSPLPISHDIEEETIQESTVKNGDQDISLKEPNDNVTSVSELSRATVQNTQKMVFMYGGQGAQYYQMARELYNTDAIFKSAMHECERVLTPLLNTSMLDILYADSKMQDEFNHILYTHPALFSVQYSLTQTIMAQGIMPDAVLGYSLGEYVAATIAGVLPLEQALAMVVKQASLLEKSCSHGSMMAVMHDVMHYHTHPELYDGAVLAGENYANHFLLSGLEHDLVRINDLISQQGISSMILPVRYAFHSNWIDPVRFEFEQYTAELSVSKPQIDLLSSALASQIHEVSNDYWWQVVRDKVAFKSLITQLGNTDDLCFLDISPTGSLSTFLKHGYPSLKHTAAMSQFNSNQDTLSLLYQQYAPSVNKQSMINRS